MFFYYSFFVFFSVEKKSLYDINVHVSDICDVTVCMLSF